MQIYLFQNKNIGRFAYPRVQTLKIFKSPGPGTGTSVFLTFEGKNSYLWRRLVGKILPLAELHVEGKLLPLAKLEGKKITEPKAGKRMF